MVLRTHTSNVQIRYMESQIKKGIQPPYRMIAPGKVFRNEATDMTHEAEFFQIEGYGRRRKTSRLAHLSGTLLEFFSKVMKGSVEVRFRPSFFPFIEPGIEVDMRLIGTMCPKSYRPMDRDGGCRHDASKGA